MSEEPIEEPKLPASMTPVDKQELKSFLRQIHGKSGGARQKAPEKMNSMEKWMVHIYAPSYGDTITHSFYFDSLAVAQYALDYAAWLETKY